MKDKAWFNLVFMFICTAIFTGILSGVYVYSRPLIEANARLSEINAQLNALDIDIPAGMASTDLEAYYDQNIDLKSINGLDVYQYEVDNDSTKYAVPFEGAGLWGEITGIIAIEQDLENLIGMDFISQNETPGLGGRIEEEWFKEQFRGITLYEDGEFIRFSTVSSEGQVDAITGATATSNAVLGIINESINQAKTKLGGDN